MPKISRCSMLLVMALSLTGAGRAEGQASLVVVRVVDVTARPIPYALVSVGDGTSRVTDAKGEVGFRLEARDSLRITIRRIGFHESSGFGRRDSSGAYRMVLQSVAARLDTLAVTALVDNPLSRAGFYDRLQRSQRGAVTAEFITPEELASRDPGRITDMLRGRRSVKIAATSAGGRARMVVLGRGGTCGMTVLLDGQPMKGMLEKAVSGSLPQSINPNGTRSSSDGDASSALSLDELVDARAVAAIEIYPSTANAPAELIPLTGQGSCGIIAIWTGSRR